MYWSHFIHHSKAIHWVINPLAYLAAGDSTAEHWGWLGHKHTETHTTMHAHTNIHIPHKHMYTHSADTRTHFLEGVAMVTHERKKPCDPTGTEDMLLDPSDQPQQKNLPLSSLKKKKKKNRIQLHSRNPLLALREWYQHHLKVWLLTKPITFWLLGNGPVD